MRHFVSIPTASLPRRLCGFGLLCVLILPPVGLAQESEKEGAAVIVSGEAGAKDVGLPIYPDSTRHKENTDDSQTARLGFWGGGSGFKLAVLKMESADSPDKIASYYKRALAKYGKILDCSRPSPAAPTDKQDSSKTLTCGGDKPEAGGLLFKSGTKQNQHIVAVQPNGKGSLYQLVALVAWGDSKE